MGNETIDASSLNKYKNAVLKFENEYLNDIYHNNSIYKKY